MKNEDKLAETETFALFVEEQTATIPDFQPSLQITSSNPGTDAADEAADDSADSDDDVAAIAMQEDEPQGTFTSRCCCESLDSYNFCVFRRSEHSQHSLCAPQAAPRLPHTGLDRL